ncbi:MAG: hypothetical protein ACFCBW_03355 [Candidatus Competibacterales bacterium]
MAFYPPSALVKVDDTAPGIAEGVAAGCVTVGVTLSGNAVGKTPAQLAALSPKAIASLHGRAAEALRRAGADYIIETVADLPGLLDRIEGRG